MKEKVILNLLSWLDEKYAYGKFRKIFILFFKTEQIILNKFHAIS